jgi:hypothetical protein
MRGTELLVQSTIAEKLHEAEAARFAKMAAAARTASTATQARMVRRDPCESTRSPECQGELRTADRPA